MLISIYLYTGVQLLTIDNDLMKEMGMYDMTLRGHLRKCIRDYRPINDPSLQTNMSDVRIQDKMQIESAVEQLMDLFPDLDKDRIIAALAQSGNQVAKAIDILLLHDTQQQEQAYTSGVAKTSNVPTPRRRAMTNQTQVNAASDIYFDGDEIMCNVDRSNFDSCGPEKAVAGDTCSKGAHAASSFDGFISGAGHLEPKTHSLPDESTSTTLSETSRAIKDQNAVDTVSAPEFTHHKQEASFGFCLVENS